MFSHQKVLETEKIYFQDSRTEKKVTALSWRNPVPWGKEHHHTQEELTYAVMWPLQPPAAARKRSRELNEAEN